jgi:hypothetical protein
MNKKHKNIEQDLSLSNELISLKDLDKSEQKLLSQDLREALLKRRKQMSPEVKLELTLMQLRFQIEEYLNADEFDKQKTLGYFLKAYIKSLYKKANEFAGEIGITPTVLSQYITDARIPPTSILVRLELHSHNTIPAESWYRLAEKERIYQIKGDRKMRREQRKFVTKDSEIV